MKNAGMEQTVADNNSALLMFFSKGMGNAATAEECYSYFTSYFETGYFVNGPPNSLFDFPFFPFTAVIDLKSGKLIGKDIDQDNYLSVDDVVSLVEQANQ